MMAHANAPHHLRLKLWREAFRTATRLDGLVPITLDCVLASHYIHWNGSNPDFAHHLRVWGEAGTVKLRTATTPKVENHGKQCIMVGYTTNHSGDTYRMLWDPSTERVHETRDIIWLKRIYFPVHCVSPNVIVTPVVDLLALMPPPAPPPHVAPTRPVLVPPVVVPPVIEVLVVQSGEGVLPGRVVPGSSGAVELSNDSNGEINEAERQVIDADAISALGPESAAGDTEDDRDWHVSPTVRRSGGTKRVPQQIIKEISNCTIDGKTNKCNYYSVLSDDGEDEDEDDNSTSVLEYGLIGAGIGGGFINTNELHVLNYKQAMKADDNDKWLEAIEDEYQKMIDYHVFEDVEPGNVPPNVKILTSTWAMKKKANGTSYRARIKSRGYEQIDGIHYDGSTKSAPVTNDITIRIIFVLMVLAGWTGHLGDVRGAFLNGRFGSEERLYMRVPQGFEHKYPMGTELRLLCTLYGLKQSA